MSHMKSEARPFPLMFFMSLLSNCTPLFSP